MTSENTTLKAEKTDNLRTCKRCGLVYDWRHSPSSSLKMTYCGSLCEMGDLGFTLEAMLEMPKIQRREEPEAEL